MADLSEDEIDVGSEDDDEKGTGFAFMSEADKKAHHNALERKRRDQIKESFIRLRDAIPETKNEKSSRAIILKRAIEYIRYKTEKNRKGTRELEETKRRVEALKKQLEASDQRAGNSDVSEENIEHLSFYYNSSNYEDNEQSSDDHYDNKTVARKRKKYT